MTAKKKPNIALWIAAGGGILVLAVAAFLIFSKPPANKPGDDTNELGPDTVRLSPSPTGTPVQLASSGSPAEPAATTSSPAAEPLIQTQSVKTPEGPPATMHFEDKSLKFDVAFPGPAADPVIADRMKDAEGYLANAKVEARQARGGQQWRYQVRWHQIARAGGWVSLLGIASEFKGGAHPEWNYDTLIARDTAKERVKFDDMMLPDHSPSAALAIAICEGLKAEKKKRIGEETIMNEPIVCAGPKSNVDGAIKLPAASTTADKFGGAYIHFPPYAAGSYAEGSYDFVVPQSVFAADLRPAYKPLFAGEPKKPNLFN